MRIANFNRKKKNFYHQRLRIRRLLASRKIFSTQSMQKTLLRDARKAKRGKASIYAWPYGGSQPGKILSRTHSVSAQRGPVTRTYAIRLESAKSG
jgi:hypothetical protein